jgi:RluA family pseudouridine synthase
LTKKKEIIQNTWSGLDKKDIVFEDSDLLVINKQAWINVHPGDFKTKESNIIFQVQDYLWEKLNSLTFKPSLIHRIDRDTSGILMIAKKKDILVKLVKDFKNHNRITKTYYAIVLWKVKTKSWKITKKLLRIKDAKNENKVQVSDKWQEAITNYKLLKNYKIITNNNELWFSELELTIETGRMHQIRVHLADLGFPIIWDKNYWDKKINSFISRNYWLNRQALHAWKIEFFHYKKQKIQYLTANIKQDLIKFLDKIK